MRPPEEPTTGYLVWRVANRWRVTVDRALAPLGLTHAKFALLASLHGLSRGGMLPSQRELADYAGLDAIYVSKLAKALEQASLLIRTENPGDPRAVQLRLTERGTDVALRAVDVVRALQEEVTAPIGGTGSRRHRDLADTLKTLLGLRPTSDPHSADPHSADPHSADPHSADPHSAGPAGDDPPSTPRRGASSASTYTGETRRDTMPQPPTLTGQDIGEAQGAVQALLEQALGGTGRTGSEFIALRVLAVRGQYPAPAALHDFLASQRQLALNPPAVASLLAELEAAGLASGTAADGPGPAQLTEQGAAAYARLSEEVGAVTRQLYADLDPDDLAIARGVLTQITERAQRLRSEL
jgi:DNA-binding MarR family transcriptional regulator